MNNKNVYKDMELFVRNEMLFIRDSLCNRYNGYGVVYETGDAILIKASEIAKHPVSKFDALGSVSHFLTTEKFFCIR